MRTRSPINPRVMRARPFERRLSQAKTQATGRRGGVGNAAKRLPVFALEADDRSVAGYEPRWLTAPVQKSRAVAALEAKPAEAYERQAGRIMSCFLNLHRPAPVLPLTSAQLPLGYASGYVKHTGRPGPPVALDAKEAWNSLSRVTRNLPGSGGKGRGRRRGIPSRA